METIIVATDFSKPADNAVEYAARLSRFLNTRLVLVHAIPIPVTGYDVVAPLTTFSDMKRDGELQLMKLRDKLIKDSYDFDISCYTGLGSVYTILGHACKEYAADLVVMGMTGEAGFLKKHVIGSNTVRVARKLKRPLLIISEQVTYKSVKNICLATEVGRLQENTLLYSARDIAQMFDAELELVTVENTPKGEVWRAPHAPEAYAFVDRRLSNTRHKRVVLHEHNAATALEYYFKFHATDMVIVHPEKHTLLEKLFSESMTKHLAFNIRVPLLVLH